MSLVDYASSDDEEDADIGEKKHEDEEPSNGAVQAQPLPQPTPRPPPSSVSRSRSSMDGEPSPAPVIPLPGPTIEKLPDASFLLNSPILPDSTSGSSDHYSRVAAALATNASRKREANGSTSTSTRTKVPRGSIPHSKNIPDTSGGHLLPPQLLGRSNVVTEDIGKLFTKKQGQT